MNLKRIIKNKKIFIVAILLVTIAVLTGCGKSDESVKTYDKEKRY